MHQTQIIINELIYSDPKSAVSRTMMQNRNGSPTEAQK